MRNGEEQAEAAAGQDLVEGVVERILFANSENSYTVAAVAGEEGGETTIQGTLPNLQCGETIRAWGQWRQHPSYGRQFAVDRFEVRLPASVHGIRRYLGSGLIPGIGKAYADRIVNRFGVDTLRVLSEESGRLREIPGIGERRASEIKRAWDEQRALRDVMLFLQTYGVGVRQCMRIVRAFGGAASTILRQDPYRLAREIDGIGFKTADRIALNLGLANDNPQRIDSGLLHLMQQIEVQGHTAVAPGDIAAQATELLQAPPDGVRERVALLIENRELLPWGGFVQLPGTAFAEQRVAESIRILLSRPSGLPSIKVDAAVAWAQERAGFSFSPEQAEAVRMALRSKVTVLTGGPGTGKTAILRAITDILVAKQAKVLLASPTGRAAQRLSESTGQPAGTVHRLLRFDPGKGAFLSDESNPLKCDMLVLDEASMLDVRLAASLLRAVPPEAHVLLVGDADQLPSVGAGAVLGDLISSRAVPVVRLRKIFRQSGGSGIVRLAHMIVGGRAATPPVVDDVREIPAAGDAVFVRAPQAEACVRALVEICTHILPAMKIDPLSQAQVLAPMHRGQGGIQAINSALQEALNPSRTQLDSGEIGYRPGDKVIQGRNDYDKGIFNGDMGTVSEVNPGDGTLTAQFDGRPVEFTRLELADLHLAYAISIHKSQGSEFPLIIVPLLKQHFMLLQRNLLYTAVTRGKQRVIIVGDPEAYEMAVRRAEAMRRQTTLAERLANAS